jgi:hypothetical protein
MQRERSYRVQFGEVETREAPQILALRLCAFCATLGTNGILWTSSKLLRRIIFFRVSRQRRNAACAPQRYG